jgi:hypothetical protein
MVFHCKACGSESEDFVTVGQLEHIAGWLVTSEKGTDGPDAQVVYCCLCSTAARQRLETPPEPEAVSDDVAVAESNAGPGEPGPGEAAPGPVEETSEAVSGDVAAPETLANVDVPVPGPVEESEADQSTPGT